MEYINEPQELVNQLSQLRICNKIDIEHVNYIFKIIKYSKPIPICYYQTELVEINNNSLCYICKKNAYYSDSINQYCWIHSQIISKS